MSEERRSRNLINPWDADFQERHGLDGMDIYRTNQAIDQSVHLRPENVRAMVKGWTPEERGSVYRTLSALDREGRLDREFTTRLGDSVFARTSGPKPRRSSVRDIFSILQEE